MHHRIVPLDLAANCWPEPEWAGASPVLVGDLGMTAEEETAMSPI
jgi:hypothetical protein